jgi:hypothetical protein
VARPLLLDWEWVGRHLGSRGARCAAAHPVFKQGVRSYTTAHPVFKLGQFFLTFIFMFLIEHLKYKKNISWVLVCQFIYAHLVCDWCSVRSLDFDRTPCFQIVPRWLWVGSGQATVVGLRWVGRQWPCHCYRVIRTHSLQVDNNRLALLL